MSWDDNSDEETNCTPPELRVEAELAMNNLLPPKSKDNKYINTGIHSKQHIRGTRSDSSPVRYKELNKPTNDWWSETPGRPHTVEIPSPLTVRQAQNKFSFKHNKAHQPQQSTPSARSVSGILSSTCSMWKTEKHETRWHEVEVIQQSAAVPHMRPRGFGSSPPAAPVTVLTRSSVANGAAGALRGPQHFVRRLLREIIASLPLFPLDANQAKITEAPIKMIRHTSTARSQSSPPLRRSLSVQTHACGGCEDQPWRETRPAKHRLSESFRKGDERWEGGLRALRDAHVRLVLRQLRHVERLNRALDRRTIARPPTL